MSFVAHLDDTTRDEVVQAMRQLGWTSDGALDALTATMRPEFAGAVMPTGGNGLARLITFVGRVNTTRVLVSGDVPMRQLLGQAILLAAGRPEELVFRTALERMSADGARNDASGPVLPQTNDVETVPRSQGQLEIAIGEDDTIEVDWLLRGVEVSRSIAKLLVHRHFDGMASTLAGNEPDLGNGTGWLIAPGLVATNHHVVAARLPTEPAASEADFALQGANTFVRFDYLAEDSPVVMTTAVEVVASSAKLDYALLRLAGDAPARSPLRLRTGAILRPKERALQERVNVLQHPEGKPMRLGFRNNFVVAGTADRLSYLTDTSGGSSGSPICDDKWFCAALHRGWSTISGDPVTVWGVPIKQENYGTPVGAILADLAAARPQIHAEIVAGQAALAGV